MTKNQKIIITYASAGAGHFKAAEALYSYIKQHHKEIEITILDILEYTPFLFKLSYRYGYSFIVRRTPFIWSLGFWVTQVKTLRPFTRWIALIINNLSTLNFSEFLIQENPAVIVSTHFFPLEVSAYLKRKQRINSQVIGIITDFGVHQFWICKGIDIYLVASEFTKKQLILEGVDESKIRVSGIPIDEKFFKLHQRSILCKEFGLAENKFTALIATGSFGLGPIEKIVDLLHQDIQILVICARNKRLSEKLKIKNYPSVRVFGYVDNIQELMAVSDIIITKPGGLSIAESLAMDLLPIFIAPIPGQETENIRFLEQQGIGFYPKDLTMLKDMVRDFKEHPEKLSNARGAMSKIKKPDAVKEISGVLCQGNCGFSG